jgi:hypothetical protein
VVKGSEIFAQRWRQSALPQPRLTRGRLARTRPTGRASWFQRCSSSMKSLHTGTESRTIASIAIKRQGCCWAECSCAGDI